MLTYKIIIIVAFCNKNEERSGKYSQISVLHFVETRTVGSSVRVFGLRDTKSVAHDTLNTNDGSDNGMVGRPNCCCTFSLFCNIWY